MNVFEPAGKRTLFLRAGRGELLPDSLTGALEREGVRAGWVRGSGLLSDVEFRVFDSDTGTLGGTRKLPGLVQALSIDGSIGDAGGEVSVGLRALLSRATDVGLETVAGEVTSARVIGAEFVVESFELSLERSLDPHAGVWLLGEPARAKASANDTRTERSPSPPAEPKNGWAAAIRASEDLSTPAAASTSGPPMPRRPPRVVDDDSDEALPEAGDSVEHFAFGRCDVLRSDGERLHLKVHKDGRIREIALEMLRVIPVPGDGPKAHFKLLRKL